MKTKVVYRSEIDVKKSLLARDYITDLEDVPTTAWGGLAEVAEACFKTAKSKGWWESYEGRKLTHDELASKLCLIHSEVSEALEDVRAGGDPTKLLPTNPHGPSVKPMGFPSELADIVIRVFDLCGFLGIDIAEVIRIKMAYNETRPYRHGGKKL